MGLQKILEGIFMIWGTQWTGTLISGGLHSGKLKTIQPAEQGSPGPWKGYAVFLFLSRSGGRQVKKNNGLTIGRIYFNGCFGGNLH